MIPPLRSFDDVDGKERGQKKTDDLRAMTALGPRTLQYFIQIICMQTYIQCQYIQDLAVSFKLICNPFPDIIVYTTNEPVHEISNNVVCTTSKASDQPAHTRSLIRAFASRLNILGVFSY